jgi:hypothetical protein
MQNHKCPFLVIQPQGQFSTPSLNSKLPNQTSFLAWSQAKVATQSIAGLSKESTLPAFKDAEFNNCDLANQVKFSLPDL